MVIFPERTSHPHTNPPTIWIFLLNPLCFVLVCPHLICLSPPIMSVPTSYVCPHLLCLSPPIMSVPTFYVCPHLLCLFSPMMSVPTHHFFADKPFLSLQGVLGVSLGSQLGGWNEFEGCMKCSYRVSSYVGQVKYVRFIRVRTGFVRTGLTGWVLGQDKQGANIFNLKILDSASFDLIF